MPDSGTIRSMVAAFGADAPHAYALDVGLVPSGDTVLVEVTDGFALGSYGLSPLLYLEPLIVSKQGRPVNRDTFSFRAKVVRPALRAAGLPTEFRTYDLRHTHASLLIDSGANVLAVAQRMGHTDPSLTLRVYGHLFEGVQEELTEALDRRREAAAGRATGQVIGLTVDR
jgi:integrase